MTTNDITQIQLRFLWILTSSLSHLFQLKQEYNNIQIKYNFVVQESYVVQDPSVPPLKFEHSLITTPH